MFDGAHTSTTSAGGGDGDIALLVFEVGDVVLDDSFGVTTRSDADDEAFIFEGLGLVAFVGWVLGKGFAFLSEHLFHIVQCGALATLGMAIKGNDFHGLTAFEVGSRRKRRTDGAASAEPSWFGLCRATEEDGSQNRRKGFVDEGGLPLMLLAQTFF